MIPVFVDEHTLFFLNNNIGKYQEIHDKYQVSRALMFLLVVWLLTCLSHYAFGNQSFEFSTFVITCVVLTGRSELFSVIIEKQKIWCINPWHKISTFTLNKTPRKAKERGFYCCSSSQSHIEASTRYNKKLSPHWKFQTAPSTGFSGILCKNNFG